MMMKTISLMMCIGLLSGCSSMFNNDTRCPFTDQGGCQSVGAINQMVKERKFSANGEFVQQKKAQTVSTKKVDEGLSRGFNSPTPYSGQPLRTEEVDARLWVAPWQDQDNNYHGSSYITFVVSKPHWAKLAEKAITTKDDEG